MRRFVLLGLGVVVMSVASAMSWADAAPAVDPGMLIPPPPPDADCRRDGRLILCHTAVVFDPVGEPQFNLPCGTVYETGVDARRGIRWYDAASLRIVRRFVSFDLDGTWSLSSTGDGPVTVTAHAMSRDVLFPDPYDPDTWPTTYHGAGFTVLARGFGVIVRVPDYEPDGDAHGVASAFDDPVASAELCEAMVR
jgi:hypothetical protein